MGRDTEKLLFNFDDSGSWVQSSPGEVPEVMGQIVNLVNTMMKSLLHLLFIPMEKEMSTKFLGV